MKKLTPPQVNLLRELKKPNVDLEWVRNFGWCLITPIRPSTLNVLSKRLFIDRRRKKVVTDAGHDYLEKLDKGIL